MNVDIEYLEEFDILTARNLTNKIKFSKRIGNVILDFDFNDKTIGAEIINASKLFGLTPQNLTAIKKGKIINVLAPDSVMVKIIFPLERPVEYIVNVTEEMPQLTV